MQNIEPKVIKKLDKFKSIFECTRCQADYTKNHYDAKKSRTGNICVECKRLIADMRIISQENIRKAFNYDPISGVICHRNITISGNKDEIATHDHSGGYLSMSIGNKNYLSHRIIFLYIHGYMPKQIDHINHDRRDNRKINLRDASHMENCKNHGLSKKSTTKINGVSLHKPTMKYRAYINIDYKQKHLGLFYTIEKAKEARAQANVKYNFHDNHGE